MLELAHGQDGTTGVAAHGFAPLWRRQRPAVPVPPVPILVLARVANSGELLLAVWWAAR